MPNPKSREPMTASTVSRIARDPAARIGAVLGAGIYVMLVSEAMHHASVGWTQIWILLADLPLSLFVSPGAIFQSGGLWHDLTMLIGALQWGAILGWGVWFVRHAAARTTIALAGGLVLAALSLPAGLRLIGVIVDRCSGDVGPGGGFSVAALTLVLTITLGLVLSLSTCAVARKRDGSQDFPQSWPVGRLHLLVVFVWLLVICGIASSLCP